MLIILTIVACISILASFQDDSTRLHPAFTEREAERHNMVFEVVARYPGIEIFDQEVLEAMNRVPRHVFVPENLQKQAYQNTALPIGFDQTISQPVIVASMTQLLEVKKDDKVLEVGTGSGYQAAVLAECDAQVYSIEIIPELGQRASENLLELGYTNVKVKTGDGYEGWNEYAPFDKIIVTCAPEEVPEALKEQLAPGGIIVIPVGPENSVQYLVIIRKTKKGKLESSYAYPVRFVPMTGKARGKK